MNSVPRRAYLGLLVRLVGLALCLAPTVWS